MGKKNKQQNFAGGLGTTGRSAGNFMRTPQGKGLIAAGAVALAGLLFSKGERAQNIRNQIRGAAGRLGGQARTGAPSTGMTSTPSMGGSGYASGTGYQAGGTDGALAH
jgi:hypothetical protein